MLLGYVDNEVGNANTYGVKYTADYAESEWKIISPFNENVSHSYCCVFTQNQLQS